MAKKMTLGEAEAICEELWNLDKVVVGTGIRKLVEADLIEIVDPPPTLLEVVEAFCTTTHTVGDHWRQKFQAAIASEEAK